MRKYRYEIWDKKTSLLGNDAEMWLNDFPHLKNGEVVIIFVNDNIEQIQNLNFIKTELDLDNSYTLEEIMNQYINNIINEREQKPEYIYKNTELKKELYQAKLTMMKEGLI